MNESIHSEGKGWRGGGRSGWEGRDVNVGCRPDGVEDRRRRRDRQEINRDIGDLAQLRICKAT